jgi:transposase InsO family protein
VINLRWSRDFVHDQLADGRRFRVLNIVDDCSRECVAQLVDTSTSGQRVVKLLDELAQSRDLPQMLVMDNGTQFTSKAMFLWAQKTGVELHFCARCPACNLSLRRRYPSLPIIYWQQRLGGYDAIGDITADQATKDDLYSAAAISREKH